MIKVRFNLGRGKNYKKWKIDYGDNIVYYSIDEVFLIMNNCLLKNNQKIANKIFNGANKNTCAFIVCDNIEIILKTDSFLEKNDLELKYNPRIKPYWVFNDINYDNKIIPQLYTVNNKVYKNNNTL